MTMNETITTRRSAYSKVLLLRNPMRAAGRVKSAEFGLFEAIEDQRLSILNVLDIVHCIGVGVADGDEPPAPEISAAFELLECEIQRIAAALEKTSLRSAMKARSGSRYSPRLA